jgi:hypothetical protein
MLRAGFSDFSFTIEDLFGTDDRVAARVTGAVQQRLTVVLKGALQAAEDHPNQSQRPGCLIGSLLRLG